MDKSKIQWTDATWNPVTGCTHVTEGCDNCYAETIDRRFHAKRYGEPYVPWDAVSQMKRAIEYRTWSPVQLHPDRLDQPMHWRQPTLCVCGHQANRHGQDGCYGSESPYEGCQCSQYVRARKRIFVNSMSDLFHPDVPDEFIAQVFATMAACPQHDFQVLTKRPGRAAKSMPVVQRRMNALLGIDYGSELPWPLPNVWVGVSVTGGPETATFLDQLARIHAAVRFVSYEPALAPFDFGPWLGYNPVHEHHQFRAGCLSCGYQWRTPNRPGREYLEVGREASGQMEWGNEVHSMRTAPRGEPFTDWLSSSASDVQRQETERSSSSARVRRPGESSSARIDHQPQEREEGRQSARELGVGHTERATDSRSPYVAGWSGRPIRDAERNGNVDRCPSCGDSLTAFFWGNAYLNRAGFWRRLPDNFKNSQGAAPVISWLVVGGESGPKARPFNVAWAESVVAQCKAARVAAFVKQIGSNPFGDIGWAGPGPIHAKHHERGRIFDLKGGDPDEWPEALRVREFPKVGA